MAELDNQASGSPQPAFLRFQLMPGCGLQRLCLSAAEEAQWQLLRSWLMALALAEVARRVGVEKVAAPSLDHPFVRRWLQVGPSLPPTGNANVPAVSEIDAAEVLLPEWFLAVVPADFSVAEILTVVKHEWGRVVERVKERHKPHAGSADLPRLAGEVLLPFEQQVSVRWHLLPWEAVKGGQAGDLRPPPAARPDALPEDGARWQAACRASQRGHAARLATHDFHGQATDHPAPGQPPAEEAGQWIIRHWMEAYLKPVWNLKIQGFGISSQSSQGQASDPVGRGGQAVLLLAVDDPDWWWDGSFSGTNQPPLAAARRVSQALANFHGHCAGPILHHYGGRLVSGGGDRLMACLPAEAAVECACYLDASFRNLPASGEAFSASPWRTGTAPGTVQISPRSPLPKDLGAWCSAPERGMSCSLGIALGPCQAPFALLRSAAEAALALAQGNPNRFVAAGATGVMRRRQQVGWGGQALAVTFLRAGQEPVRWGAKLGSGGVELLRELMAGNGLRVQDSPKSLAAAVKLQIRQWAFYDLDELMDSDWRELLKADLLPWLSRHGSAGDSLARNCHQYLRELHEYPGWPETAGETVVPRQPRPVREFHNLLVLASYLDGLREMYVSDAGAGQSSGVEGAVPPSGKLAPH